MKRIYTQIIHQHFTEHEQMLFLAGPRQVGKTTLAKEMLSSSQEGLYLNWDNETHQKQILAGETAIIDQLNLSAMHKQKPLLILDELHKFKHWKNYLKGFYDTYKEKVNILVTGSAKLDIYKTGGDSLMGRYLLYRIHPLSIAELLNPNISDDLIQRPNQLSPEKLNNLIQFGGYPDPYLKENQRFANQWKRLKRQQLFNEDIRELQQIADLPLLQMLAELITQQASSNIQYSNLAKAIRVSTDTIRRWINILESFYFCFTIKPWYKNVKRSLIKEPKIYLWDWSEIKEKGAKIENFVAQHILKAVHFWTDHGFGDFELFYLRDKDKREVDFLICRDKEPWILIEVKNGNNSRINKNLHYFQEQLKAPHAFQLSLHMPYLEKDCFQFHKPIIVPMSTFLSQLI